MNKINLTLFDPKGTVYPVHNNTFKVGDTAESLNTIAGIENFSPSFEGNVESWYDMTQEGWQDSLVTGKAFNIALSGKRSYGDAGNDLIAGLYGAVGTAANKYFEWTFANGAKLSFACAIDVTNIGGGDSTGVDSLECTVYCKGKPTYTPAAS